MDQMQERGWTVLRGSFAGLIAVVFVLATLSSIADEKPITERISDLEPIPLKSGINEIPDFNHDGRTGMITLAWRGNGNAHGYDLFMVMMETSPGNEHWSVVNGPRGHVITDYPHFGEDMVRSVRFVRARLDGEPTTMLIVSDRRNVSPLPAPVETTISFYRISPNDFEPTTHDYFDLVGEFVTDTPYCNAEIALQTELGMAVRSSYRGPDTEDGCFE